MAVDGKSWTVVRCECTRSGADSPSVAIKHRDTSAVAGRGGEADNTRRTGAGVARRQAHHERMRDERAREAAAGDAELPPEDDAVEMASAVHVLDCVAEVGANYTLLLKGGS